MGSSGNDKPGYELVHEDDLRTPYFLDPEKYTIGGQSEDSGKFHVRIRAAWHR